VCLVTESRRAHLHSSVFPGEPTDTALAFALARGRAPGRARGGARPPMGYPAGLTAQLRRIIRDTGRSRRVPCARVGGHGPAPGPPPPPATGEGGSIPATKLEWLTTTWTPALPRSLEVCAAAPPGATGRHRAPPGANGRRRAPPGATGRHRAPPGAAGRHRAPPGPCARTNSPGTIASGAAGKRRRVGGDEPGRARPPAPPWTCTAHQLSTLLSRDLSELRVLVPHLVTGDGHGAHDAAQAALRALSTLLAVPDSSAPWLLEAVRYLLVGAMQVATTAHAVVLEVRVNPSSTEASAPASAEAAVAEAEAAAAGAAAAEAAAAGAAAAEAETAAAGAAAAEAAAAEAAAAEAAEATEAELAELPPSTTQPMAPATALRSPTTADGRPVGIGADPGATRQGAAASGLISLKADEAEVQRLAAAHQKAAQEVGCVTAERATAPHSSALAASALALAALAASAPAPTAPMADPPPPTGAATPAPSLATQNIAVAAAMAQLGRTPASAAPRAAPAPRTAASKRALFHTRAEATCADSCKPLRCWARSDLLRGVCFPLVAALVPDPPQIDRVQELLGGLPPRVAGHIATACRRVAVRLRPYYGPDALWETAFSRVLLLLGRLIHPEGTAVPRAPAPAGRAASAVDSESPPPGVPRVPALPARNPSVDPAPTHTPVPAAAVDTASTDRSTTAVGGTAPADGPTLAAPAAPAAPGTSTLSPQRPRRPPPPPPPGRGRLPAAHTDNPVTRVIRWCMVRHKPFEGVIGGYKCSVVLRGDQRPEFEVTPAGSGAALSSYRDLDDHFHRLVAGLE